MKHESNGDTNYIIDLLGMNSQRFDKKARRVGNRRTNRNYPNYSIVKIKILRRVLETQGDLLLLRLQ